MTLATRLAALEARYGAPSEEHHLIFISYVVPNGPKAEWDEPVPWVSLGVPKNRHPTLPGETARQAVDRLVAAKAKGTGAHATMAFLPTPSELTTTAETA